MQSMDEHGWARIRWTRDELLECDRVLIIGHETAALAALLVREGLAVSALETDRQSIHLFHAVLDREELASDSCAVEPFSDGALHSALAEHRPDAVAIVEEHGGDMRSLLASIFDEPARIERLVVVIPFGLTDSRSGSSLYPRGIVAKVPPTWSVSMDVNDGHLRVVATKGMALGRPDTFDLLEVTESGATEEHERRRLVERELQDTREALQDAEKLAEELRTSTSFRLGQALVTALRSPREFLALPISILRIVRGRQQRNLEQASKPKARAGLSEWEKERLRSRARHAIDGGADAVIAAVDESLPEAPDSLKAFAYLVAAQACNAAGRHDLEFEIANRALELNRSIGMLRGFLHVALRCRQMEAASEVLREIHAAERAGNQIAKRFLANFREASSYKIAALEAIPPRLEYASTLADGRFAYILHNSLPYSSGGYATRSHGVATGLRGVGVEVICLTRPGFPLDMKRELAPVDVAAVDVIDGVPYQRINEPLRANISEYRYVLAAANRLEAELARLGVSYVQAASNYVTGLPALIAARRLGVPFFYEVRGLWEITRMSRDEEFAKSISFDVQRHLEGTLAREADHVFTLTEPMREELIDRGVDPERISLLPNSVDAKRFVPVPRDDALARQLGLPEGVPVIGYVGTFVIYEGLEHLAEACVELHRQGRNFRLLLVGNENASGQGRGPITEEILRICMEGGIEDKLILPGRIPHEQVESYYSLIDICPFPRKPWPVCEMVSPMKPLEALAMEKAVVVSSVRALAEMVEDDVTGVVFEKGNTASLATAIDGLMADPERRRRLGRNGREFVVRERSWTQVAERILAVKHGFDSLREHEAGGMGGRGEGTESPMPAATE
ncbi:glycosyltransferase [Luteimonas sp. SJ-92]|uniref:Glycosyltransferase n=1 Tax=Luteimonas salinisoli TaxID=2752307 RepID=A0A853J888_9GAMM|nr:glycosyltransferase family 4 protein [Luteimonas salinisoli]NZA25323.1 glycosyltransferase [Luteimonas salinisoli]